MTVSTATCSTSSLYGCRQCMMRSAVGRNTGAPVRRCAKNTSPQPKRYKTASTETLHYKITSYSQFLRQKNTHTKTEQQCLSVCLSLSSTAAALYRLTMCNNKRNDARYLSVLFDDTVPYSNNILHSASRR